MKKIIQTVKRFFTWLKLAYVREYRDLSLAWIEALRPPRGIELPTEHIFVTLGEVQQIIGFQAPVEDLALRRDQAGVALLFLSGMRASAFAPPYHRRAASSTVTAASQLRWLAIQSSKC